MELMILLFGISIFIALLKVIYHVGKVVFIYLDLTAIFFVAYLSFLYKVGKNIADAPACYFWSFLVGLLAIFVYMMIIFVLSQVIPVVFILTQILISYITAFVFQFMFFSSLNAKFYGNYYVGFYALPLLKNEFYNVIVNIILLIILVGVIFFIRKNAFEENFDLEFNTDFKFKSFQRSKKVENEYTDKQYEKDREYEEKIAEIENDEKFIMKYTEACDTLNLSDYLNPTFEEIKENYRNLAKKYHPDINNDKVAKDLFKRINIANDFLTKENIEYYAYLCEKYPE